MASYKGREIKICENKYINDNIKIKDIDYEIPNYKRKIYYKCDICGEEYVTGNTIKKSFRKICPKHHFYYKCDYCGKEFEIIRLSDFVGSEKDLRFCSHDCTLQHRNRTDEMRNAVTQMNISRVDKNLNQKQICKNCGKEFYSIFIMDKCNSCIASEVNKRNNSLDQVCEKCGEIFHSPFIMKIGPCCNPNLIQSNFITKDNIRFYKGKELNQFCEDLLSGKENINEYPGFEIRFGRVCYNRKDVLTNEKLLYNVSNFILRNNVKYVLDKYTGKYILWENKVKYHLDKMNIFDYNEEIQKFINIEGFNIEPIFNTSNDLDLWNRKATNEYLVEQKYEWCCYIKMFQGHPFIVGKTGTTLVHESKIDFDFVVGNENDESRKGPGRRFIRENFPDILYTDHNFVLVKNFKSEVEALNFERYISQKYNLFES